MRAAFSALLCLVLCAQLGVLHAKTDSPEAASKWAQQHVGKEYWVHPEGGNKGPLFIQDYRNLNRTRPPTFYVSKVERVKIVRPGENGYAIVRFEDGVEAMLLVAQLQDATAGSKPNGTFNYITSVDPKKAAKKEGVRIGMTKEEVLGSSWGKPREVNQTHTAQGTTEQWVYGGGYLYFRNGRLEAVQN